MDQGTKSAGRHSDIELAKACRWLVKTKRQCTVTHAGEVVLNDRPDQPSDATSHYRQMLRSLK